MMDNLYELYEHFQSYIKEFVLKIDDTICYVSYTPLGYDFIDSDLDFDEEYFERMMSNFDRFLESYIKDMFTCDAISQARIRKSRMVFRDTVELEYERTFEKQTKNKIMVTEKRLEMLY